MPRAELPRGVKQTGIFDSSGSICMQGKYQTQEKVLVLETEQKSINTIELRSRSYILSLLKKKSNRGFQWSHNLKPQRRVMSELPISSISWSRFFESCRYYWSSGVMNWFFQPLSRCNRLSRGTRLSSQLGHTAKLTSGHIYLNRGFNLSHWHWSIIESSFI